MVEERKKLSKTITEALDKVVKDGRSSKGEVLATKVVTKVSMWVVNKAGDKLVGTIDSYMYSYCRAELAMIEKCVGHYE
jgi:hypothetical protein